MVEPSEAELVHTMKVERIWEAPRVTRPYTEQQWIEVERLGHEVDEELRRLDVRLTMGGEPTFVSIEDPDGAEWNTAALGPNKRTLATARPRTRRNASCGRLPGDWASRRDSYSPPARMPSITCGVSGVCHPTSTHSIPDSRMPASELA
jgi:hypothetical protein